MNLLSPWYVRFYGCLCEMSTAPNVLLGLLSNPEPSYVSINAFYQHLEKVKQSLASHRDELWKRFLMASLNLFVWGGMIAGAVYLGLAVDLVAGIGVGAVILIGISLVLFDRYQTYGCFNFFSSNGQPYLEQMDNLKDLNQLSLQAC